MLIQSVPKRARKALKRKGTPKFCECQHRARCSGPDNFMADNPPGLPHLRGYMGVGASLGKESEFNCPWRAHPPLIYPVRMSANFVGAFFQNFVPFFNTDCVRQSHPFQAIKSTTKDSHDQKIITGHRRTKTSSHRRGKSHLNMEQIDLKVFLAFPLWCWIRINPRTDNCKERTQKCRS